MKKSHTGKHEKQIIVREKVKEGIKNSNEFAELKKFHKLINDILLKNKNYFEKLSNLFDSLISCEVDRATLYKHCSIKLKNYINLYEYSLTGSFLILKYFIQMFVNDCNSRMPKPMLTSYKDMKEDEVILACHPREDGKIEVIKYTKETLKAKQEEDNKIKLNLEISLKKWNSLTENLNQFIQVKDQYIKYVDTYLDRLISTLDSTIGSEIDLSTSWSWDDELITPKRSKKLPKENQPVSEEKALVIEKIKSEKTTSKKNPQKKSEKLPSIIGKFIFSKDQLSKRDSSSFHFIHQFNHLLQQSLNVISIEGVPSEWSSQVDLECGTHLFLLGCGFDLFLQAVLDNRLADIPATLKLFLDVHTLFEQLMQKEYVAQYGDIYKDDHSLINLLEETTTFKKLDASGKLMTLINISSLWTRYPKYFQQKYQESKQPEILKAILFALEMATLVDKGPLKLTEEHCKKWKQLTTTVFSTMTLTYDCLFQYIEANKGKNLASKLMQNWMEFLNKGQEALLQHLDKQTGKTIKMERGSSLKETSQNLTTALELIEKTVNTCSLMQTMKQGNPILRIEEAEQHIRCFLASLDLFATCDKPILNAFHMRNLLGASLAIEQLLKAVCMLRGIQPADTHNLSYLQQLIIDQSSNEKYSAKIKILGEKAEYFNIKIGLNYLHLYDDPDSKCLEIFKNVLKISPDYIEENEIERNELEVDEFNEMALQAAEIMIEYVQDAMNNLTSAHQKIVKKKE